MVERFLWMIFVQVLSECVFSMEMSSEHMMKVSTSLLLCNISAIQEMCSLASPDAIIPIRFIYLCVLNCITCINKNKHTVYGSRSMSDEGRTTTTTTYSIGNSTFQADWEKPCNCIELYSKVAIGDGAQLQITSLRFVSWDADALRPDSDTMIFLDNCRTHRCMLNASISSSNTSRNSSNVPFRLTLGLLQFYSQVVDNP